MPWIYRLFWPLHLFTLFINTVNKLIINKIVMTTNLHCAKADLFFPPPLFTCIPDLEFITMTFLFANTEEWAGLRGWCCPWPCCPAHALSLPSASCSLFRAWAPAYQDISILMLRSLCANWCVGGIRGGLSNCMAAGEVPVLLSGKRAPAVSIQNATFPGFYLLLVGKNNKI